MNKNIEKILPFLAALFLLAATIYCVSGIQSNVFDGTGCAESSDINLRLESLESRLEFKGKEIHIDTMLMKVNGHGFMINALADDANIPSDSLIYRGFRASSKAK